MLRYGHKVILREQIKLLEVVQSILRKLKKGYSFKDAYFSVDPLLEKDEHEMIENRKKIRRDVDPTEWQRDPASEKEIERRGGGD